MNAPQLPEATLDKQRAVLCLNGPVSFDTALHLAEVGRSLISRCAEQSSLSIDIRGVQQPSSATLTVVLEWWRAMNKRRITLAEVRLPNQMAPLVALSGLEQILPCR